MAKELDDTLDDQLDINELEDDELQDDELGNAYSTEEDPYSDDEEDEDEEDLTPPKTGLSPIMKGILAFTGVAVAIGTAGIAYLTIAGGSAPAPVQNTAMSVADTVAPDARDNMAQALNEAKATPVLPASVNTGNDLQIDGLSTPEQIVQNSGASVNQGSVVSDFDLSSNVKPEVQVQPNASTGMTKEEMDKFKEDLERELEEKYLAKFKTMSSSIKSDLESELTKKIADSSSQNAEIVKLRKEIQELKDSKLKLSDNEEIKKIYEELETKLSVVRLSEEEKDELLDGRKRLQGFMVLTASLDGEMSIVRTPSDRVNVFFKGEIFNNAGDYVKVTNVTDGGYLVLVGDNYFIDETYVERSKVKTTKVNRPAKKQQTSQKPKVEEKNAAEKQAKVKPTEIDSRAYRAQEINGKKVAVGWVKSGEYSQGYLVASPSGDWTPVKIGDELKGLGRVTGEDFDGNLIVGNFVVLAAE
ncbi:MULTISPECIES: hypothetical protein [Vibrio]|uniref:hypothetical protein n=1 Tax=Vibrio TaxID=662 RepID=UPI000E370F0F|nr:MULTISPECIES: hypothetical protein [Vibrio]HAT8517427.1 hypothetical protein [Vibrio vulnificus]MCF9167021.1 hypothetical protein [Vibrio parahaemolyticus]MCI4894709.1 hypothetical protein [Vibrio parahaemolyticus]MDG3410222.1 hypothetical protein [Vibrio parahaemolyticus]MDW1965394.1 hypothetical protein [Vibrio sp. Vb0587]